MRVIGLKWISIGWKMGRRLENQNIKIIYWIKNAHIKVRQKL